MLKRRYIQETYLEEISMKKILLVSHEMTYTGAPRSMLNLAIILREENYLVEVATLETGEFESEYNEAGFSVFHICHPWDDIISKLTTYDLIIANTIFCLHFAHFSQGYTKVLLFLREANNIKEICNNCSINDNLLYEIKNIVCVSEYAQKCIYKNYGIKNIRIIHNFVKEYKSNFIKCNKERHETHFLVSGTIEKRKQQDVVIRAFENMDEKYRSCSYLHIVGKNPIWSKEYWETFYNQEYDHIFFHGEISDEIYRMKLYSKMDVFIIPSYDEACSLVALEGASLGKALLMSQNVGAGYLLKGKRFFFQVGDVDGLSRKMESMCNKTVCMLLGKYAWIRYYKSSSKKIYKRKVRRIIKNILNE